MVSKESESKQGKVLTDSKSGEYNFTALDCLYHNLHQSLRNVIIVVDATLQALSGRSNNYAGDIIKYQTPLCRLYAWLLNQEIAWHIEYFLHGGAEGNGFFFFVIRSVCSLLNEHLMRCVFTVPAQVCNNHLCTTSKCFSNFWSNMPWPQETLNSQLKGATEERGRTRQSGSHEGFKMQHLSKWKDKQSPFILSLFSLLSLISSSFYASFQPFFSPFNQHPSQSTFGFLHLFNLFFCHPF